MKFVRLTSYWGTALLALILGTSTLTPFRLQAETSVGESFVYPIFRLYRSGLHAAVTEATLERIFLERLRTGGPRIGRKKAKRLARHLYELCRKHRMDPAYVLSVIQVESSFRSHVVSPAGAIGLMQIMPGTARYVAPRHGIRRKITAKDLRDPFLNLSLGVAYLRELRDRYAGLSAYYPLAAYNLGPARLDELRARPDFKPSQTWKYYQAIMRGVNDWRHYGTRANTKTNVARENRSASAREFDSA